MLTADLGWGERLLYIRGRIGAKEVNEPEFNLSAEFIE